MDGEVSIVGAGDYIEIWNSESWAGELETVTDSELNAKDSANTIFQQDKP